MSYYMKIVSAVCLLCFLASAFLSSAEKDYAEASPWICAATWALIYAIEASDKS